MKREDVRTLLGDKADDATIDKIMALNGADIEKHKIAFEFASTELTTLKGQLTEANKQIETFKGMKIEDVQKAAIEWEQKAKKAETDATAQIAQLKFDHTLDSLLSDKEKNGVGKVKVVEKRKPQTQ